MIRTNSAAVVPKAHIRKPPNAIEQSSSSSFHCDPLPGRGRSKNIRTEYDNNRNVSIIHHHHHHHPFHHCQSSSHSSCLSFSLSPLSTLFGSRDWRRPGPRRRPFHSIANLAFFIAFFSSLLPVQSRVLINNHKPGATVLNKFMAYSAANSANDSATNELPPPPPIVLVTNGATFGGNGHQRKDTGNNIPIELLASLLRPDEVLAEKYRAAKPPKPCHGRNNSNPLFDGVCMFQYECLQLNGEPVGYCFNSYLVGTCCRLPDSLRLSTTTTTTTTTTLTPRPSSTTTTTKRTPGLFSTTPRPEVTSHRSSDKTVISHFVPNNNGQMDIEDDTIVTVIGDNHSPITQPMTEVTRNITVVTLASTTTTTTTTTTAKPSTTTTTTTVTPSTLKTTIKAAPFTTTSTTTRAPSSTTTTKKITPSTTTTTPRPETKTHVTPSSTTTGTTTTARPVTMAKTEPTPTMARTSATSTTTTTTTTTTTSSPVPTTILTTTTSSAPFTSPSHHDQKPVAVSEVAEATTAIPTTTPDTFPALVETGTETGMEPKNKLRPPYPIDVWISMENTNFWTEDAGAVLPETTTPVPLADPTTTIDYSLEQLAAQQQDPTTTEAPQEVTTIVEETTTPAPPPPPTAAATTTVAIANNDSSALAAAVQDQNQTRPVDGWILTATTIMQSVSEPITKLFSTTTTTTTTTPAPTVTTRQTVPSTTTRSPSTLTTTTTTKAPKPSTTATTPGRIPVMTTMVTVAGNKITTTTTTAKPPTIPVAAPQPIPSDLVTVDSFNGTKLSQPSVTMITKLTTVYTSTTTTTTTARPETVSSSTMPSTTTTTKRPMSSNEMLPMICGRRQISPKGRVVGGTQSAYGEWPWMVSLRQWKKNAFLHKCGAALLNEYWVITAAHCVENVSPTDLLLRLGEYDISTDKEPYSHIERRIQIIAPHPKFDPRTFEYDLALLRFYEPIRFQKNIIPICLPEGNDTYVGRWATVTGWGRLHEDGPLPNVIQHVDVPIITNKECESMYRRAGYIEDIPDIFICAGLAKGTKDSCEGDSGGPLVIEDKGRWTLVGVISWGIGCALPNQPGVYTRITAFTRWINQIIAF